MYNFGSTNPDFTLLKIKKSTQNKITTKRTHFITNSQLYFPQLITGAIPAKSQ